MYKVKQLYVDVSDDSGHTYLIKIEDLAAFERELQQLEDKLNSAFSVYDEDDYYSDFENLLEHFDAQKLEGERVYVVLENDLIEGDSNMLIEEKFSPTVCGIGVKGYEQTKKDGKVLKEYDLWKSMLRRCYVGKSEKKNIVYTNCTVSENFKYYSYFKEWSFKQKGFYKDNWDLDKDILVKGNKLYSEDTCCFVPHEINQLFTKRCSSRGSLPIGVSYHKHSGKYQVRCSYNSQLKHVGYFSTPEEAFLAYKQAKEQHIKFVANKWKDMIDPRVYEALMNYEVEIND